MSDPHGTIGIYRKGGGIMKIESLDVLKAKQQLDLLRMYEQLTLPLDFGIIEINTNGKERNGY